MGKKQSLTPAVTTPGKKDRSQIVRLIKTQPGKLEVRPKYLPITEEFRVVKVGGKIVACCALSLTPEIRSLVVDEKFLGNGFAKMLVLECERIARRMGARQVVLMTEGDTMKFFHSIGYDVKKGTRSGMVKDLTMTKRSKKKR